MAPKLIFPLDLDSAIVHYSKFELNFIRTKPLLAPWTVIKKVYGSMEHKFIHILLEINIIYGNLILINVITLHLATPFYETNKINKY